jgi:hypothetical protein
VRPAISSSERHRDTETGGHVPAHIEIAALLDKLKHALLVLPQAVLHIHLVLLWAPSVCVHTESEGGARRRQKH